MSGCICGTLEAQFSFSLADNLKVEREKQAKSAFLFLQRLHFSLSASMAGDSSKQRLVAHSRHQSSKVHVCPPLPLSLSRQRGYNGAVAPVHLSLRLLVI